jgi:tRNA1Val (adenine37-N6)-methyltransferase
MAKSGTHFHFKQFSVAHDRCTMKVGTDGVLLGAWAAIGNAKTILDIGTGSGVIALMLAQRTPPDALIHAVELEQNDAQQAHENVAHSPWSDKVKIFPSAIQQFAGEARYDLIVSNPPYFINSQEPPDKRRLQTRHTVMLSFAELLGAVTRLLKPDGTFQVILPYTEGLQFIELASQHGLHCTRQWSFRTRANKPIERWLLAFSRIPATDRDTGEVLLYSHNTVWDDSYTNLTRDFYLNM